MSFTASAGNEALMSRPGTNYYERSCLVGPGPGPGPGPGTLSPVNPQGTQFSRMDTVPSKIRVNTVVQHAASQSSVSCSNIFFIVTYSYIKTNEEHQFLKFIFGIGLYVSRTGFLSIIRSLALYTQQQVYVIQVMLTAC